MLLQEKYTAKLGELESELFSESAVPVLSERFRSNSLPEYKEFRTDHNLAVADHLDPVSSKILNIADNARRKVNRYLMKKSLDTVGLPSYLEIKDMPHVCNVLLADDKKQYVLPTGNVGASYNTETDAITFYKAMVSGSKENKQLKNMYRQGIKTANELMSKYPKIRKPLQKLMRFYSDMIDNLDNPEKAEQTLAHEYGHKVAQGIKNASGESLNYQIMSAPLSKGDEEKAVEAVEGFNVLFTDNVVGKKTTQEETTYDAFGERMIYVLRALGETVPSILSKGHYNSGKRVSNKYISMN